MLLIPFFALFHTSLQLGGMSHLQVRYDTLVLVFLFFRVHGLFAFFLCVLVVDLLQHR